MKAQYLALPLFSLGISLAPAAILFSDNFDVADNTSFDAADTLGRLSGTLADDVVLRAHRAQQQIQENQLLLIRRTEGGAAGVRFENAAGPYSGTNRFDWAAGTTGADILASGGFEVSFDWTPADNTNNEWFMWAVGTPNADSGGSIVNAATTDYGILVRNTGGTQRFDNGTVYGDPQTFTTTAGGNKTYAVSLTYTFPDFADGTSVTAVTSIDGVEVANDSFEWDDNAGVLHMEIGTNTNGNLIDNLTVSTLGVAGYNFNLANKTFASGASTGTLIGDLSGSFAGNPDPSTFSLVAGTGDTDNDKFQINGSNLEVGNFDFTGANSVEGQTFSVRIAGVGSESAERVFALALTKDDDLDKLPDGWEITWANNLSDLSATVGDEDFDQDGLTDAVEYELSTTYPDLDPTEPDTDNDTLLDGEEVNPTGIRPATNPTSNDTDFDGLTDTVETNSGTFVNATNTGTDPANCDSDGDFASDSWEVTYGTNPLDPASFPAPVGPVAIIPITDNASTGIDPGKTYTHLISGGQSVTLNGVTFDALDPTVSPANFAWDTMTFNKDFLVDRPGDWDPITASVSTELEALLTSFTYSGNGAAPGSSQRFTLSNLTPGAKYDLRIYSRSWDTEGSGRPIDLVFTNGAEIVQPYNALPLDRPGLVTGSGDVHDAYYLTYQYTAQNTELIIDASLPLCGQNPSGSLHLYALSNEISTGVPLGQILITDQGLLSNGQFAIAFKAKPQTTYQVTKSSDLVGDFAPLNIPVTVTTDINGEGQVSIPTSEVSDLKTFYRIEE
ncbi:hypothetical protein V2O64_20560 [Verrucomicrobiaceae bacterium 227]